MQRDRPRDPIIGVSLRYLQPVELAVLLEELSLRFYAFALSLLVAADTQIQSHLPDVTIWAVAVGARHRRPPLYQGWGVPISGSVAPPGTHSSLALQPDTRP